MNGDLLSEFKNKKAEYKNYAYYYSNPADIMNSMKDVNFKQTPLLIFNQILGYSLLWN